MEFSVFTAELEGHAARVLTELRKAFKEGTLPHGIILSGQEGIGKATLAAQLAHLCVGGGEAALSRIIAGSHTDLLMVAPAFDEKKGEYARDISVEQARKISEFLAYTAAEGAWRVVIVDGAEKMNLNAANAILKILEEPPPQSVILLVTHQLSRLLPTIRSRCRTVKLAPLSTDEFAAIIKHVLPGLSRESTERLAALSDHSPGVALWLYEQGALDLQEQMDLIFESLPQLNHERALAMAEQVAGSHTQFKLFTRLALHWLAQQARHQGAHWADAWHLASEQFMLCESRHLDYKSAAIGFFHSLADYSKPQAA